MNDEIILSNYQKTISRLESTTTKLEATTQVLETKMNNSEKYIEKIDQALDKLQEIATNIVKMVNIHEERINNQKESELTRKEDLEKLSSKIESFDNTHKEEIATIETSFKAEIKELSGKFNKLERLIYFSMVGYVLSILVFNPSFGKLLASLISYLPK